MSGPLRVGTRRSPLARAQTDSVVAELSRGAPRARFAVVPLDSSGDRDRGTEVSPDFTATLDRALLDGELDLAVHSAKDLPVELDPRLALLGCPLRADPRDGVVAAPSVRATSLPHGARVGSSSTRRRAQLLRWRPDLSVVAMRGNVDTRLRAVRDGRYQAAVLAVAGLARLGRRAEIGWILPAGRFVPAPAQGAIAVVGRADDAAVASVVRPLDDPGTHAAILAERAFAAALGGDCRLPLGALATVRGARLSLVGEVLSPDGRITVRGRRRAPASDAAGAGRTLGAELRDRGAAAVMTAAPTAP